MARRIVVTSGKGGVGKTTICVNLAYALGALNKKVLLVDTDFGLNNLDVVLGVENKIVYDLFDCVEGKCRPDQALIQDFACENVYVLPTNRSYCPNVDIKTLSSIVMELESSFDYVLIDCPAGIDEGFYRAVSLSNEAIIVTTPHLSSVRDCDKVLTRLQSCNVACTGLVVNRVRGDLILRGEMLNVDSIKDYLSIYLIGVVPEDDNISIQLLVGGSVAPQTDCGISYDMIAKRIAFGNAEVFDCTQKYKGLVGSIRQKLRKFV